MTPRLSRLPLFVPLLAAMLLAAGCSNKIVVCPVPAILADTNRVSVMRAGTAPDLANELYSVALTDAKSDCVFNQKSGIIRSSLDLTFKAVRAPSTDGATYNVPFFVVVSENAKLFSKRLYELKLTFAPGAATTTVTQSPEDISIQLENGKLPWNYQLLAGFQMTQAQIDYAKIRSRYLP